MVHLESLADVGMAVEADVEAVDEAVVEADGNTVAAEMVVAAVVYN